MPRKVNKRALSTALVTGAIIVSAALGGCNRTKPTEQLLAEAKQYQQKGEIKAAMIELKNAVANSPENGEARLALGSLHVQAGDYVSAEKELRKALSLGIDKKRVLPPLGRALEQEGKFKELLDTIAADTAAGSAELLALRGSAYLGLNDADKAKDAFAEAAKLQPDNGDVLIGMSRLALLQKDAIAAQTLADQAVAKDPKNADAWMFKGALARGEGKMPEALAAFTKASVVKPDHRTAFIEKALIEINLRKFDEAKADLDAARKLTPGSLQLAYTQSLLDFTKGQNAAALESIQKVLKSAPDHLPSMLLAGAIELRMGSYLQAEQHLGKYVKAIPDNTYARKLLAQAQLQTAPSEALATLAPALKNSSDDPQLLALAGETYLRNKDYGNATNYLEKATALAPKVAALHTSLGLSRMRQGDQAKGLSELELAASLDNSSPKAGIALVQAEMSMKHYDKALAAAQALVKQQPDNAQVQALLGTVYASMNDQANARASLEKALAIDPVFFPAAANLAQMDLNDKKPADAEARFTTILKKDPKNIGAMTALAELADLQGQPDKATTWFEKASSENPTAVGPGMRLANHYLKIKQAPKALTVARKLQTENPTDPNLLDLLGQVQLANNDTTAAIETYSKLVNVQPKSPQARYRLASAYAVAKRDDDAASELKKATSLQPDFLPAQLALAELSMRKNRPEEALAIARGMQKQPRTANAGLMLEADILMTQKKIDQALPLYEKAQASHPTTQVALTLHRLQKMNGKEQKANQVLTQWLKDHPDDVQAIIYSAEQSLYAKQYQAAATQLESALKLAPNNALALNNLAWTYQQLNNPKALETAEKAYSIAGNNPAVLDTLGSILTDKGDTKRAVDLLQKAVTAFPNNLDMQLHLGEAQAKNGDKAGARKTLEKVSAANKGESSAKAKELLQQM
ncbi:XrtA/PEP-CTERM system TPR-repeat protein PrsT [Massilia sp. 2TAF26]|uniref:XrtA/PEP-CTERM system TPR-repeat protein PrsT n=1 Tax=Massilia sp. 2TAF26 TaxID=3233012 RepID=UPI003F960A7A